MNDIATLGLEIDASGIAPAVAQLDKLTDAAKRAETASSKVGEEVKRQSQAMTQASTATSQAATTIDRTSKAYQQLDAEVEKLLLSTNKQLAAQSALGKGQAVLSDALNAGVISQKTYNDGLASLTTKFGPAAEGAAKLATSHNSGAVSTSFLTRELRALGDEVAGGRMRQAEGTSALLATRLLALGPAGLAAAAAIAAVGISIGVVVSRSEEMQQAIKNVQTGFAATGNASLLSQKQIKDYIDTLALLPGVSRASAETVVAELSRIPYITGPLFDQASKLVSDFSVSLGVKATDGAKKLAAAFEDPIKGADALDKQFNLLTADQRLTIDAMARTGDQAGALAILMQALEDRFGGATQRGLTPLKAASNELAVAWDNLLKSFTDPNSAIGGATSAITSLLLKMAELVDYVRNHQNATSGFIAGGAAGGGGSIAGAAFGAGQQVGNYLKQLKVNDNGDFVPGESAPSASQSANRSFGDLQRSDRAAQAAADARAAAGQAQTVRTLLDETKQYQAKADINKTLLEQENKLKDLLKDQTLSATARAEIQSRIAGIDERMAKNTPKGRSAIEPLTIGVDDAALNAELKASDQLMKADKAALEEQQKYRDFYHKLGIINTEEYNRATEQANQQYLAKQQAIFADEIASAKRRQEELEKAVPSSPAQSQAIQTALIKNQERIVTLKAEEAALTAKITADDQRRATEAPYLANQEAFNKALKQTQEIQTSLTENETRTNLEVQLGIKTQFEGIHAVSAAREDAIAKMRQQLDIEQQLLAAAHLDHQSDEYIARAKAIDQLNTKLLQMQANLDPIGQKINGIVDTGFTSFLDKLDQGVHSFKDLGAAGKAALDDIGKQLFHLANQEVASQVSKAFKGVVDSATGGTGGIGGFISRASGASGTSATAASNDEMADFIKNLDKADSGLQSFSGSGGLGGAIKSSAAYVEKLIFGTTAETAASSATSTTTGAMVTLTTAANSAAAALARISVSGGGSSGGGLGGLSGLFGGGTSALASTSSTAGSAINVGITDEALALFHSGGIVGEAGATRQVRFSSADVAAAPRFHSGGVSGLNGYNEQLAVLKYGEEVLTENDPRHRNNGGRSGGRTINVTNNFNVPKESTLNQKSRYQVTQAVGNSVSRAAN